MPYIPMPKGRGFTARLVKSTSFERRRADVVKGEVRETEEEVKELKEMKKLFRTLDVNEKEKVIREAKHILHTRRPNY